MSKEKNFKINREIDKNLKIKNKIEDPSFLVTLKDINEKLNSTEIKIKKKAFQFISDIFPIGSIVITSINNPPSFKLGGKEFVFKKIHEELGVDKSCNLITLVQRDDPLVNDSDPKNSYTPGYLVKHDHPHLNKKRVLWATDLNRSDYDANDKSDLDAFSSIFSYNSKGEPINYRGEVVDETYGNDDWTGWTRGHSHIYKEDGLNSKMNKSTGYIKQFWVRIL